MKKVKLLLIAIIGLAMSFVILWVGWEAASTSIDLDKSLITKDVLQSAKRAKNKTKRKLVERQCFLIATPSRSNEFWIFRSSQDYTDLEEQLMKGDSVTIYHEEVSSSNNYYTVHQLEQNGVVIYSKEEYEKKERALGRYLLIPTSILLAYLLFRGLEKRWFMLK